MSKIAIEIEGSRKSGFPEQISSKADPMFAKKKVGTETSTLSGTESEDDSQNLTTKLKRDHDVDPIDIVFSKEVGAIEPTTGIVFPASLNHYMFIGCGVRTKYMVFHAFALGLYLDVGVKAIDDIHDVLVNPEHPKVFRLVMNRNITSSQYMGAIYERLTPLMKGQDMDKLEELKTQDMPTMLHKGMEIFLMVKGSNLIIQMGTDRAGVIESIVLTSAICENYLGDDPASPATKTAVLNGMKELKNNNIKRLP